MPEDTKHPTHFAFAVLDPPQGGRGDRDDGPKAKWLKLGAGWENQDGSISCLLDVLPLAWMAGFRGLFKIVVQPARDDDHGSARDNRGSGRDNRGGHRR